MAFGVVKNKFARLGESVKSIAAFGIGGRNTAEAQVSGDAISTMGRSLRGDMTVVAELPQKLKDWSEALVESRRNLSQFSGAMAAVFAQQQVRQIRRDIESGQRTAGSTGRLNEALDDLKDEIKPIQDDVANILQSALLPMLKALTGILVVGKLTSSKILAGFNLLAAIDDNIDELTNESKHTKFVKFMDDAKDGRWPVTDDPADARARKNERRKMLREMRRRGEL